MRPGDVATVRTLYQSFAMRNGAGMAACYAENARFDDPVFSGLRGREIGAMWSMLCASAEDLQVALKGIEETPHGLKAQWSATYTFSRTGRRVVNHVEAHFSFDEAGLIATHIDKFNFWCWSARALGPVGWILGWTPFLRQSMGRSALESLTRFRSKESHRARS